MMKSHPDHHNRKRAWGDLPVRLAIPAAVLTSLATAFVGYWAFGSSNSLIAHQRRNAEIKELQGNVIYLDELLTMSARMAAATGKRSWEGRYNRYVPVLDSAIQKLKEMAPVATFASFAQKTDAANRRLVEMELRSFALTRENRRDAASKVLFSPEYERQKRIYSEGMSELTEGLERHVNAEQEQYHRRLVLSGFAGASLLPISLLAWVLVIRRIRRWEEEVDALNVNLRAERDSAERANQAKSLFLANISHELRTPMHGILSFAHFGQQKIESAPKEKLKSYFDEIHESGARLMSLLNDLLDLTKLEAGKIVYSMSENDLNEIVRSTQEELRAFAEEKSQTIEFPGDAQAVVGVFDGERIRQVIRNLLSNAIKFSDGQVPVRVLFGVNADKIRLEVINRGIGIPESELESVFDKFAQSSKTRTGAGGTGLGLAISREIVRQHRGRIWAECEPGGETRMIVELPRVQAPETGKAA